MVKTDDYILRITNASPVELVIITYDILIDGISEAIHCHGTRQDNFISSINTARDALMELIGALDMENAVAAELYPLYRRVNELLIGALVYEKKSGLEEALRIIDVLREGWIKIRDTEPSGGALYKNAPRVYSGLTYGRKGPNDYIDTNPERGIKA